MIELVRKSDVVNGLVEVGDIWVSKMVVDAALVNNDNAAAVHEVMRGLAGYSALSKMQALLQQVGGQLTQNARDQLIQAATAFDALNIQGPADQLKVALEIVAGELGIPL